MPSSPCASLEEYSHHDRSNTRLGHTYLLSYPLKYQSYAPSPGFSVLFPQLHSSMPVASCTMTSSLFFWSLFLAFVLTGLVRPDLPTFSSQPQIHRYPCLLTLVLLKNTTLGPQRLFFPTLPMVLQRYYILPFSLGTYIIFTYFPSIFRLNAPVVFPMTLVKATFGVWASPSSRFSVAEHHLSTQNLTEPPRHLVPRL